MKMLRAKDKLMHEKLGKYYDAEGIKKPYLPPQIPNKNNA